MHACAANSHCLPYLYIYYACNEGVDWRGGGYPGRVRGLLLVLEALSYECTRP
jgi:hypothetical protein